MSADIEEDWAQLRENALGRAQQDSDLNAEMDQVSFVDDLVTPVDQTAEELAASADAYAEVVESGYAYDGYGQHGYDPSTQAHDPYAAQGQHQTADQYVDDAYDDDAQADVYESYGAMPGHDPHAEVVDPFGTAPSYDSYPAQAPAAFDPFGTGNGDTGYAPQVAQHTYASHAPAAHDHAPAAYAGHAPAAYAGHAPAAYAGHSPAAYAGHAVDPFAPVTQGAGQPLAPWGTEPLAVQASPSLLPGQMRAAQASAPLPSGWDDELQTAPSKGLPGWLKGAALAAAVAVAGVVGTQVMAAQREQQERIAQAEKTRLEMVAEETARHAEEARKAAEEQARQAAAAATAAAAAAAGAPTSAVAGLLAQGVRSSGVSAPSAARPTGIKAHKPSRARKGKASHRSARRSGDSDSDSTPMVSDSESHSDDPIYGL